MIAAAGVSVSTHSPSVVSAAVSRGSRAASARPASSAAQPAATAASGTAVGRCVPAATTDTSRAASSTAGTGASRVTAVTPRSPEGGSDVASQQDERHGAQKDLDVEPDRPVGAVDVVDLHHLVQRHARGAEHLPHASHARGHIEPAPLPALDLAVL